MKIAISTERADLASNVAHRFGLAPYLLVVDTETMDFKALENPGAASRPGAGVQAVVFAISEGAQVTLMWDPNTEPDIAGYKVHYGTASNVYLHTIDVGSTETCTVTDLQRGITYYFSATAYNTLELESDYSNEVIYTVPL